MVQMNSVTPRIGVFLCRCHGSGSCEVLDFQRLKDYLKKYSDVVFIEEHDNFCSDESRELFKKTIKRERLDRVLLGMCSPSKHLEEFRESAVEIGMNQYMVDAVNIREQIAYIHVEELEEAQLKLHDQFAMGLAKLRVTLPADKVYAVVDEHKCNGCEICYTVCDKEAIKMVPDTHGRVKKISSIDLDKCWGCGVCVTSCPVHAMDMTIYSNKEMTAQVDAFIENMRKGDLNVLILSCHWCAYPAADAAGKNRMNIDPHFRSIRTLCSGRVDPDWILKAITSGADGVLLLGGKPHACHFESGNMRTMTRMKLIKLLLSQTGLHDNRFHVEWMDPEDPVRYAQVVNDFIADLRKLGPNPLASIDSDYSSAKLKSA